MKNFIFISPHFPHTYWEFCKRLKQNGVRVLGIADAPYESLSLELRQNLTEYYRVTNMEDYDQMYRGVAYFAFRYGKIDWIESNNEYWLEQDARLRTDFNVTTGLHTDGIQAIKRKSEMKKHYAEGGIPTARQLKGVEGLEEARKFAAQTGFPLIAKPDIGVGAGETHKLHNEKELEKFFLQTPNAAAYVLEEFITGDICSYDAVIDSHGDPIFESMTSWPPSIMDIVNKGLELSYHVEPFIHEGLRDIGRRTVNAFHVKSRFVHLEFFRLDRSRPGLGEAGDFVALEVNMRPAGGYTPDMMNYAHSTDVYKIWADMVAFDECRTPQFEQQYCAYASRRNGKEYVHSHEEVLQRYGEAIVMHEPLPEIFSAAMGNYMYTAKLHSKEDVEAFTHFVEESK